MTGAGLMAVLVTGTILGQYARIWTEGEYPEKEIAASDCEVKPLAKNKDGEK